MENPGYTPNPSFLEFYFARKQALAELDIQKSIEDYLRDISQSVSKMERMLGLEATQEVASSPYGVPGLDDRPLDPSVGYNPEVDKVQPISVSVPYVEDLQAELTNEVATLETWQDLQVKANKALLRKLDTLFRDQNKILSVIAANSAAAGQSVGSDSDEGSGWSSTILDYLENKTSKGGGNKPSGSTTKTPRSKLGKTLDMLRAELPTEATSLLKESVKATVNPEGLKKAVVGTGSKLVGLDGELAVPVTMAMAANDLASTLMESSTSGTDKGKGVAKIAGSTAGSLAGAEAGAALGTLVAPGIGTAAGGVIGGTLGYIGGEALVEEAIDLVTNVVKDEDVGLALGRAAAVAMTPFSDEAREAVKEDWEKDILPKMEKTFKPVADLKENMDDLSQAMVEGGASIWDSLKSFGSFVSEAGSQALGQIKHGYETGGLSGAVGAIPGAATTIGQGVSDGFKAANNNYASKSAVLITNLMTRYGLTKEQAAGMVGNLGYESGGLQPDINEKNPLVKGSKGGYGWAQWTGTRRKAFEDFAAARGLDMKSDEANWQFLQHELDTTHKGAVDAVKRTSTVDEAVSVFEKKYEGADPRYVNMASRSRYAKAALDAYSNGLGTGGDQHEVQGVKPMGLPTTVPDKAVEGQLQQAIDGPVADINGQLMAATQSAIDKGVKYKMGARDSDSGQIDCSGWVTEINKNIAEQMGNPDVLRGSMDAIKKGQTAAGIIQNVGQLSGTLEGDAVTAANLKPGMLLGVNAHEEQAADRYKGIDHIAQVVQDPVTGQMMVSESSSSKGGVATTPLEQYLSGFQKRGKPLYAVDPYAATRGQQQQQQEGAVGDTKPGDLGSVETNRILLGTTAPGLEEGSKGLESPLETTQQPPQLNGLTSGVVTGPVPVVVTNIDALKAPVASQEEKTPGVENTNTGYPGSRTAATSAGGSQTTQSPITNLTLGNPEVQVSATRPREPNLGLESPNLDLKAPDIKPLDVASAAETGVKLPNGPFPLGTLGVQPLSYPLNLDVLDDSSRSTATDLPSYMGNQSGVDLTTGTRVPSNASPIRALYHTTEDFSNPNAGNSGMPESVAYSSVEESPFKESLPPVGTQRQPMSFGSMYRKKDVGYSTPAGRDLLGYSEEGIVMSVNGVPVPGTGLDNSGSYQVASLKSSVPRSSDTGEDRAPVQVDSVRPTAEPMVNPNLPPEAKQVFIANLGDMAPVVMPSAPTVVPSSGSSQPTLDEIPVLIPDASLLSMVLAGHI
jgi:hypothetical protein